MSPPLYAHDVTGFHAYRKVPPCSSPSRRTPWFSGPLVGQPLLELTQIRIGQLELDISDALAARVAALRLGREPGVPFDPRAFDQLIWYERNLRNVLIPAQVAIRTVLEVHTFAGSEREPSAGFARFAPVIRVEQEE